MFNGDWVVQGRAYSARLCLSKLDDNPVLLLDGLRTAPEWAYHPGRFEAFHIGGVRLPPIVLN